MSALHTPKTSLAARLRRGTTRLRHCKPMPTATRSIVTFGFDDCPRSVVEAALPQLERKGWQATLYIAMGLCDTVNHLGRHMSAADVKAAQASGHHIADHTYSHYDAEQVPTETFMRDIDRNAESFDALGLPPAQHFAYPYGAMTAAVKKRIAERFATARGVRANGRADAANLPAQRLFTGPDIETAIAAVSGLKQTPRWLHLFSHDVRDDCSPYGCTPHELSRVIDAVERSGAAVLTVDAAWKEMTS